MVSIPMCAACGAWGAGPLCESCRQSLQLAPERITPAGVLARAAFRHEGTARLLVHELKYRAAVRNATLLANAMADLVPGEARVLVPLPRSVLRRVRYGVDPAVELAHSVGRIVGLPVLHAFAASLWWPSHAGTGHRATVRFTPIRTVPDGALLVDDVVTTGLTVDSAVQSITGHVIGALLATASAKIGSARDRHRDDH